MDLDEREAYEAMIRYLTVFHLPRFPELGAVLGELKFQAGGQTGDPAAWFDWLKCVSELKTGGSADADSKPPSV